ncbi:MAG TPA: (Fe-S)-binding protein [Steroidobacteraceae bacterium]|nr:(Fe-S)-binding protein [Steroidobacteraceae bacterium]
MSAVATEIQRLREELRDRGATVKTTELPAAERIERVKDVFRRRIDANMATYLETCLHCGMCAEVCHFYEATGEGKYTPIYKVEPLRRFYRRELAPMGWLRKLVLRDITPADLDEWQKLVYDACTQCGRCDMICPMGIYISPMIGVMREAIAAAGMQPAENKALAKEVLENGTLMGIGPEDYRQVAADLQAQGIVVPLDKPKASVVVLMSAMDAMLFRGAIGATAQIMNRLGLDWTIRTNAGDAAVFDWTSGDERAKAAVLRKIVAETISAGARTLLVPECGHGFAALRWDAANVVGTELPFEVMAISEFLGREIEAGRLKVKPLPAGKSVTYHDPCKVGRWSGVFDEPRNALKAIGVEIREMESHAKTNYCCGGGGGVVLNERANKLRAGAFHIKMKEADATGAGSVVTACGHCRMTFIAGAQNANWQKPIESLVELVAANLA